MVFVLQILQLFCILRMCLNPLLLINILFGFESISRACSTRCQVHPRHQPQHQREAEQDAPEFRISVFHVGFLLFGVVGAAPCGVAGVSTPYRVTS